MDTQRVDLLLQYILAIASQEDDFKNRQLGAIHLIKYVYLADLAYAEKYGVSYTQAPWRFHIFGPWAFEINNRITLALKSIGAESQSFFSQCDHLISDLETKIDILPRTAIKKWVHQFGSDTKSLLTHVYLTQPLLTAAPGENLNFNQLKGLENKQDNGPQNYQKHSNKDNKKVIAQLKQQIQAKLASLKAKKTKAIPLIAPRYDMVFFQGQKWLESLEGNSILPLKGEATFSAEIWKSKARFDPDVS